MSHSLINRNADLKRLRDEGFDIEVRESYLLAKSIPYVNHKREVKRGVLVSPLELAGDATVNPVNDHVIRFMGDHPCDENGELLQQIQHSSKPTELLPGLTVDHQFSAKPPGGYADYYEKIFGYAGTISRFAKRVDPDATAQTFAPAVCDDDEGVFVYLDTASSRAEIGAISEKLKGQRIAIVGLGGTGAYVLDFVSKAPVAEIRLIDGDFFHSHNAFRSPGAASLSELRKKPRKVDYLRAQYSAMHRNLVAVPEYMDCSNLQYLEGIDFAFLCVDNGEAKGIVMEALVKASVPFIDSGIGVINVNDQILGQLRITTATPGKTDHIQSKVPLGEIGQDDPYVTNIQIADLNALCASLAVIRWKKWLGFYADLEAEHNCLYVLDGNRLYNEDTNATPDTSTA